MAAPSTDQATAADLVGGFTPEVFSRHLSVLSSAPAWWLERKRSAYARFESLPMPSRTDEGWRFSNISGVTLGGYAPAGAGSPAGGASRPALAIEPAATLEFLNGRALGGPA